MAEIISKKAWGVDLYTTEELIVRLEQINTTISEYDKNKPFTALQKQVVKMRDAFANELALRKGNDPRAEAKRLMDEIIEQFLFENRSYLDEDENAVKIIREYQNRWRRSLGFNPRSEPPFPHPVTDSR